MPTYKQAVRSHIQAELDRGFTQADMAKKLEMDHPNFLSTVLNLAPKYTKTLLPMMKLPLLQRACGLSDCESLRLWRLLCAAGGDAKGMQVDSAAGDWLIKVVIGAKREADARRAAAVAAAALTKAASHV